MLVMTKLRGAAAEARLAEAWEKILGHDPARQEIIHVLAQPAVEPEWISEFPVFQAWMKNGCEESAEIWRSFAEIAESWSYIINARRAGIPNVRILVLRRSSQPEPWLQYLSEVHLPAISALSGETLYTVWAEDCRAAGIQVRDHDVNLFGAAGVMMAGGDNGDVEWRAFADETSDPDLFRRERDHVLAIRDYAVARRKPAELPAIAP